MGIDADGAEAVVDGGGGEGVVAASCQNLQPAGTRPEWAFTPAGTVSVKEMATGGC